MNHSTTVFLINRDVKAFTAVYEENGKVEVFKTLNQDLKKDDIVVVESGTRHNFTTVKIKEFGVAVDIDDPNLKVRWQFGDPIDQAAFAALIQNERDAIERVKVAEFNKRRKDLLANMVSAEDVASIKALPLYKNGTPEPAMGDNSNQT